MRNVRMRTIAALTLAAAGLTACVGSVDGPQSAVFGEGLASVRAQAVPVTVSDAPPQTSGQAAAAAVQRYHEGKTKPVETYSTSTLGGLAGGGSGGAPE